MSEMRKSRIYSKIVEDESYYCDVCGKFIKDGYAEKENCFICGADLHEECGIWDEENWNMYCPDCYDEYQYLIIYYRDIYKEHNKKLDDFKKIRDGIKIKKWG